MHFWMFRVCLLLFMEVVVHVNTNSIILPTTGSTTTRALGITNLRISTTISATGVSSCLWIYGGEFSTDTFYSNAFGCSNYTGVNETITCVNTAGTVTSQLTYLQPQYKDLNINMQCSPSPSYSVNINLKECNDTYQGLTPSNNANYLGTATFKCIGANQISLIGTCQPNATWSISGSCPAVQCNTTAATDATNGIILTNSALLNTLLNVNDTVNVGCGTGFNGTGGSRTCQADGTWSAPITCARVCNTSAVESNGICLSSSATPNSNVAVGSVVSLTCCVGYIPDNGIATCANDGGWNTALVCTLTPTTPDRRCLWFIVFAISIGIFALVLWTIKFYRIYETELGYGKKFLMLFGTVTVIPIVIYVIHQYCTKDRGGKRVSPELVLVKKDWDVWFILCIWLPLIPGILMFRQWHKDVYLIKKENPQKEISDQAEPQQKWFMAICIVLGIPMVIYYFVDKSSIKPSNNEGDGVKMSVVGRTSDKE